MVKGTCENPDCTVAVTGICLESHKTPQECLHFRVSTGTLEQAPATPITAQDPPVEEPIKAVVRQFHSGMELGTQDAAAIMKKQYVHLIGILGAYDAGKTCFLTSLYLLASHRGLNPEYLFSGSLTLQGFEDRARGSRLWSAGVFPEKLSEHTSLQDPRSPAFMHLALTEQANLYRRLELLLTDLPGEWTENLIDREQTATRFEFLKRADGIIYVLDGPQLANSATRHVQVHRSKLMLERLMQSVKVDITNPIVLLISKSDKLDMVKPQAVDQIYKHAVELGFKPTVIMAAAFSSNLAKVKSGAGVLEAINTIVNNDQCISRSPQLNSTSSYNRSFGRFQAR